MSRKTQHLLLMRTAAHAAALAIASASGAALAQTAPADDATTEAASDDGIVVTARKVKERLEDVPIAITALGGGQLRNNDHIRLEEINQLAPSTNVVITNGHQTSFTIRGLGANPGNDGLESSAGVFVDGVYLGRPGMAAMDFIDIQQLEVLRGPQGTLFGKNTTAGAINITTALPKFELGGLGQVTAGKYGYQQYQGSVTGPLTDDLAARLTAYHTTRDGIADNITTGSRTGTIGRTGVRGQLYYKPTEDFSIRAIGEYTREQQSAGALPFLDSYGANRAALQKKLDVVGATIGVDPNGRVTAANGGDQTGTRQWAGSVEINWTTGGFTLTSISAYRHWDYSSFADSDTTSADVGEGGYDVHDQQWTQELRLALPHSKHFDAIIGAFYFGQKQHMDLKTLWGAEAAAWLTGIPDAQLGAAAAGSPTVATLLAYNHSRWDVIATPRTDSFAGFGQATVHLTPQWNITGGVRVTYERKSETVSRANPVNRDTGLPIAALASQTVAPIYARISNTAPSFLVSTDYRFAPGVMAYALVSRGQKAGGLNTSLPAGGLGVQALRVEPETATNYEAGLKADLLNHRLAFNVSIYRTDVKNYQATYLAPVSGTVAQYLTNVGKVRTQGFEAETTVRPLTGLTLHGYLGYTDAKYQSYTNAPCPLEVTGQSFCDLSGRPIAGAPKWTSGVNSTYEHDVTDGIVAYLSGEYSYRSKFFGSLDDSKYSVTGDYGILNLRFGIKAKNDLWDLSIWGKNVTDRHFVANYLNYSSFLPGVYASFFGDPATYGATLRTTF